MAISVELGPGMRLDAPSTSRKSARDTHPRRRTNSSSIIAICAAGPPKAIVPSRRKDSAICFNSETDDALGVAGCRGRASSRVMRRLHSPSSKFGKRLAYFAFGLCGRLSGGFGGEAAFEDFVDLGAAAAQFFEQALGRGFALEAHLAREREQRGVVGGHRPCGLIAFDPEAILQAREELKIVGEAGGIRRRHQRGIVKSAEQGARVAGAQRRIVAAMPQRHHLRDELDIDQSAPPLLEIEAMLVLGADLVCHPLAHRGDLRDAFGIEAPRKDEFLTGAFDFGAEAWISRDYARADQRRALPYRAALAMV